jgi:predicted nuclease of predicted toxin-antitoxin system
MRAGRCKLQAASDEAILQFALANHRVICTLDADFHTLLAVSGASGPSVVRIRREGMRGAEVASLLFRVWSEVAASIEQGAAVTVTEKAIRLRRLPIGGHLEADGSKF